MNPLLMSTIPAVLVLLFAPGNATAAEPSAALHVLTIGIEPDETRLKVRDWYARDAEYVRDALLAAKPLYREVRTQVVNGEKATRANVIAALDALVESVTADDVAVVFFSSHGSLDDQGRYYIPLAETRTDPATAGAADTTDRLLGRELMERIGRVRGRTLLLLDTCCAGGCLQVDLPKEARVAWLLACDEEESSSGQYDRQDRPHGYFVIALCEALAGRADADRNGVVTFAEVTGYVPDRAAGFFPSQNALRSKPSALDALPLAKSDPNQPAPVLFEGTPESVIDLAAWNSPAVRQLAEKLAAIPVDGDENAADWGPSVPREAKHDVVTGAWGSRWKASPTSWVTGTANVTAAGTWLVITTSDSTGHYLILAKRRGDRLMGQYLQLDESDETTPWVGRIVGPDRIDGCYDDGTRWDLRRQPAPAK